MEMMKHQKVGVDALLIVPNFALFDEPGIGKSRQVIEAANVLFMHNDIDLVLIVCPAQCIFNWFDPELGEVARWSDPHRTVRVSNLGLKGSARSVWSRSGLRTTDVSTYIICSY